MLSITFKKGPQKHTISCLRQDGTVTWMNQDDFFIQHDLIHYAVELELQWTEGFYGMLASGTDITDFEKPKDERTVELTLQAVQTEHIVNLMQQHILIPDQGPFVETLRNTLKLSDVPFPETLTEAHAARIKEKVKGLFLKWDKLPVGEELNLDFQTSSPII